MISFAISFLYLSFCSYKIAYFNSRISFIKGNKPSIVSGIFLQLINPKTYNAKLAVFPIYTFINYSKAEVVIKLITINLILFSVHFLAMAWFKNI